MLLHPLLSTLSLVVSYFLSYTVNGSLSNDLTNEEIQALEKLKPMVWKLLYKDYMKNDHYMARFLRARKMNVIDTRDMLLKHLNFRRQHKLDSIINETMEIEGILPYLETSDRLGRPVVIIRIGDWKFRSLLIRGRYKDLMRLIYKKSEIGMEKIRQAALVTGTNITQGLSVTDVSGLSRREHSCLLCIQLFTDIMISYESNYPQAVNRFYAVNVPRLFSSVWEIVKPVLSELTRRTFFVYGHDKNEWRKALLEVIANDQLPPFLGGTFGESFHT